MDEMERKTTADSSAALRNDKNSAPNNQDGNKEFLRVRMQARVGALEVKVEFGLTTPWTCLFGASGSGKTTVLRAIAGFVRPDRGRIVLRVTTLFDDGVWVPAYRRRVRTAAQQAWLLPGTVRANVQYGGAAVTAEVLALLRLEKLAEVPVERLSGGERQRVSVARAVAAAVGQADLLLLDEPFAGMDARLRDEVAVKLRDWLAANGIPVLSVTHDVGEAFLLEAEVVRIAEGRVVAQGVVGEVLAEERARLKGVLG